METLVNVILVLGFQKLDSDDIGRLEDGLFLAGIITLITRILSIIRYVRSRNTTICGIVFLRDDATHLIVILTIHAWGNWCIGRTILVICTASLVLSCQ